MINYVMFEFGYFMYVYDCNWISGIFGVWFVWFGEIVVIFDGIECKFDIVDVLIVDDVVIVVIGGVMGVVSIEVWVDFIDVLLEVVIWDLVVVLCI